MKIKDTRWFLFNFLKLWNGDFQLPPMKSRDKKGVISEYLPWLLISIAVLAILMITIYFLRQEGVSMIDKLKSILKFR